MKGDILRRMGTGSEMVVNLGPFVSILCLLSFVQEAGFHLQTFRQSVKNNDNKVSAGFFFL